MEQPQVSRKSYLGDQVYADHDGYHLVLTTENGIETTNTIFLEPAVVKSLLEYLDKLKAAQPTREPAT